MQVSAKHCLDLILTIEGTYVPSYNGGHDEPSYGESIEDHEVTGIAAEKLVRKDGKIECIPFDLLKGCDVNEPNLRRFLNNLADFVDDDADEALIGESEIDDDVEIERDAEFMSEDF
jgi:hypothetical protein